MDENRLRMEKDVFDRYIGPESYRFEETAPGNMPQKAWISAMTNSGKCYTLIVLLRGYPEMIPEFFVLNEWHLPDCSAIWHTLRKEVFDGKEYIRMCLADSSMHRPDMALFRYYVKGLVWLEAVEAAKKSNRHTDDYLRHQTGC